MAAFDIDDVEWSYHPGGVRFNFPVGRPTSAEDVEAFFLALERGAVRYVPPPGPWPPSPDPEPPDPEPRPMNCYCRIVYGAEVPPVANPTADDDSAGSQ